MNWRDPQAVERFLDTLAREIANGAGHPAAIEAARVSAEKYEREKTNG